MRARGSARNHRRELVFQREALFLHLLERIVAGWLRLDFRAMNSPVHVVIAIREPCETRVIGLKRMNAGARFGEFLVQLMGRVAHR